MLTGIRDLDREIVNNLDDKDLLNMCLLNRIYSQRVLNDDYFRLRTENGFPETVPYKDYINPQTIKRTWKTHYLSIVKYIDLLERNYRYIYRAEDKSPELLYLARQSFSEYSEYDKDQALIYASLNGKLELVKYLVENEADITAQDNESLIFASAYGKLSVVKYLVEHGADVTAQDNEAVRWASETGHLPVVKYLVEHGADINAENNRALRVASFNGHLLIVKYLVDHGANIHSADDSALRLASENGHSEVVKYLTSLE